MDFCQLIFLQSTIFLTCFYHSRPFTKKCYEHAIYCYCANYYCLSSTVIAITYFSLKHHGRSLGSLHFASFGSLGFTQNSQVPFRFSEKRYLKEICLGKTGVFFWSTSPSIWGEICIPIGGSHWLPISGSVSEVSEGLQWATEGTPVGLQNLGILNKTKRRKGLNFLLTKVFVCWLFGWFLFEI